MTITPHIIPAAPANVAPPAGASYVSEWIDETDKGDWGRYFAGTRRGLACVRVDLTGWQDGDGAIIEHHIACYAGDGVQLSAETARDLAADLLAAADELDELSSYR